jgi:polygalacturonase
MSTLTRRRFLLTTAAAAPGLFLVESVLSGQSAVALSAKSAAVLSAKSAAAESAAAESAAWARAEEIVRGITVPTFPAREFDITTFGAIGDGQASCTDAIRKAIVACRAAGGGHVVVPDGRFLTGPVRLESGVDLHLADKATLAFTQDPGEYLPVVYTRWEGVELMNYSPFIYAFEAENIAITGRGTLDGQADADHWWSWNSRRGGLAPRQVAARTRLMTMQANGVPVAERVFGEGSFLRPNFIQPYRSRNILIEGVTIVNSPMWEIHPVLSRSITVRNVSISSLGPNNDGCDPESCRDVLIDGCTFDTGDDCIALKSGRNEDGRRVNMPIENVVVRNCTMKAGHGGIVVGSEISGGARHIFAEKCRMDSPRLDRALRIKTNSVRGGTIEGIYMRDVTIGQLAEAVVTIDFLYEEGDAGQYPPTVRDVVVSNVTSGKSRNALLLRGYKHDPIAGVRIVDCRLDGVQRDDVIESVKDLELVNVRRNGVTLNGKITR